MQPPARATAGSSGDITSAPTKPTKPTKPPKPTPLEPLFDNFPDELRKRDRWVLWRYEYRFDLGKWDKPLWRVDGQGYAKSNEPGTWASFAAVRDAYQRRVINADGVGFVTGDGVIASDTDHCRDKLTGGLTAQAQEILDTLSTYSEASPSGEGTRALALGLVPLKGKRRDNVEMYGGGQYVTITGHHIAGTPTEMLERTAEFAAVHAKYIARKRKSKASTNGQVDVSTSTPAGALSDDELLEKAFANPVTGAETRALWNGDTSGHKGESEADYALAKSLAWWTGRDTARVRRLMLRSQLVRDKWDSPRGEGDYLDLTIDRAIENTDSIYLGKGHPSPDAAEMASFDATYGDLAEAAIDSEVNPDSHTSAVGERPPHRPPPTAVEFVGLPDPLEKPSLDTLHELGNVKRFSLTELGNAERLAYLYSDRLRFVPGIGWHYFDGTRWVIDTHRMVTRLAAKTVKALLLVAHQLTGDASTAMAQHAIRSMKGRSIAITVDKLLNEQSVAALIVEADQLDADHDLLNCLNGTLNLRTGTLRGHNPRDLITKLVPVAYDPDAAAALWERFQRDIAGGEHPGMTEAEIKCRDELVAFKRRAWGYTLTGHTKEQIMVIAHGSGANGKSTEFDVVADVMADYASVAAFGTFATGRDGQVKRFGLAHLAGARFVRAVEGNQGDRLAEGTVKAATGGEPIDAEFKGLNSFRYRPRFTLWLGTNHKPNVIGTDNGTRRRLRLVPYPVQFEEPTSKNPHPTHRIDRDLPTKLRKEMPGILAWMVAGAREWYQHGLGEAQAVTDATDDYRADQDQLLEFVRECIDTTDPNAKEGSTRLHAAYEMWALEERQVVLNAADFKQALGARGLRSKREKRGVKWLGLKLTTAGDAYADQKAAVNEQRQGG